MANYEYKVLNARGRTEGSLHNWAKDMNKYGAEGWKIIEMGQDSNSFPLVILMREV